MKNAFFVIPHSAFCLNILVLYLDKKVPHQCSFLDTNIYERGIWIIQSSVHHHMESHVSLLFQLMIQTTGGNMDANVVFSQQSYIPRSANFNFTTDLFGHSLNLLEVGLTCILRL